MHLELSVIKGGKEGKSKLEVSNPYRTQRLQGLKCFLSKRSRDG